MNVSSVLRLFPNLINIFGTIIRVSHNGHICYLSLHFSSCYLILVTRKFTFRHQQPPGDEFDFAISRIDCSDVFLFLMLSHTYDKGDCSISFVA